METFVLMGRDPAVVHQEIVQIMSEHPQPPVLYITYKSGINLFISNWKRKQTSVFPQMWSISLKNIVRERLDLDGKLVTVTIIIITQDGHCLYIGTTCKFTNAVENVFILNFHLFLISGYSSV